jgi:hypothetical protein
MGKYQQEEAARLYAEMMGAEAAERQRKEAIKRKGGCVCNFLMVKKRWDGTNLSVRKIHEQSCAKFRWWMTGDNLKSISGDEN